jgi:hypothetical protein
MELGYECHISADIEAGIADMRIRSPNGECRF